MSTRLITQLNPFSSERKIQEIENATIQEIINKIDIHKAVNTGWRVLLNDEIVTDFQQETKDGDTVYLKIVPEGDNQELGVAEKWIGGVTVVAGIAMIVAGIFTGGSLSAAGVGVLVSGISTLASGIVTYNLNIPDFKNNKVEQSPAIRGSRNQERLMGYVPILFGKRRIYTDRAAASYTWVDNNENQYLYQLFCAGQKDIVIDEDTIKIGETNIVEFSATKDIKKILNGTDELVSLDIAYGRDTLPAGFEKCIHEEIFNTIIKKNIDDNPGDISYTTPDNTTELMLDFFSPNGLGEYDEKGNLHTATVQIDVLYKYVTDVSPGYSPLGSITLSAEELKTKRGRISKVLPKKGQVNLIIKRITDDHSDSKIIDDVYLGSIRSLNNTGAVSSVRRKEITLISLKLKASEKMNSFVEQFNFVAQSVFPVFENNLWQPKSTSNPASAAIYAMQGEMVQQKLNDEEIDWPAFERLYQWCDINNYECNEYVYNTISISELLMAIGSTCRAEILRQFGKITVIQDIKKDGFTQIFTPRNSWDYQEQILFPSIPDAMSLGYIDENIGYAEQELKVYNTPTGNKIHEPDTVQDVNLWGVTNSVQARKIGMYNYAVTKNRPLIHKFSADFEYMLCQKGDWIKYAGDIALAGIAQGRITRIIYIDGYIVGIEADEELQMEPEKNYSLRIRLNDGDAIILDLLNYRQNNKTVMFKYPDEAIDISENDLFVFGESQKETIDLLITDIQCGENLTADIIAVEYAPEIFKVDEPDFVLPDFENKISDYIKSNDNGVITQSDWQTYTTYNDKLEKPELPIDDGNSNGWHTYKTPYARWQSSKIAKTVYTGQWSDPLEILTRGTCILKITTAPTAYTTQLFDITPAFRIPIDTVTSQSKVTTVYAGDVLQYSYYQYQVILVTEDYVYTAARTSIRGSTGATGPAGPAGPAGSPGKDGEDGTSVKILGSKTSTSQLPSTGELGDGWLINGDLYIWNGTSWENVGRIQGPTGATGKAATQYYIHYVYCDDIVSGINYSTTETRKYIGTYTDTIYADATIFANVPKDAIWSQIEGDTGATGKTGPQGIQGNTGAAGKDGVSPTITTSKSGSTTTITITDAKGTKTATITDGSNGISLTNKGNWAASTAYKVNDYVYYATNKTSYVCKTAHTSGTTFSATNWTILSAQGATGNTGKTGDTGATGKAATQYYIHYVYCDDIINGENYSTTESRIFIGTYVDTTEADAATFANVPSDVVWSRITIDQKENLSNCNTEKTKDEATSWLKGTGSTYNWDSEEGAWHFKTTNATASTGYFAGVVFPFYTTGVGKTFTLSCKYKTTVAGGQSTGSDTANYRFYFKNGSGTNTGTGPYKTITANTEGEWKTLVLGPYKLTDAVNQLRFMFRIYGVPQGEAWVKDIKVEENDVATAFCYSKDDSAGGYMDYQFAIGAFDLTETQIRALTWYDAPPAVTAEKPCLYMASKWIS